MANSLFDIARKIIEEAMGLASDAGTKLADAGISIGGQEEEAPQQYAPAAVQQPDVSSYDVPVQQQPAEQPSIVAETDSEEGGEGQGDGDSPSELRVLAPLVQTMNDMLEGAGLHRDPYQGSAEQLRSFEDEFRDDQAERLAKAQSASDNQLYSNYAMMGINPYDDSTFREREAAVRDMDEVPSTYADAMRRFADEEGNFKFNPLDWNIIGFNSQTKTPKAARDIYDWHFQQEALDNLINGRLPEQVDRGIVDENAIDDGRSAGSRESLFMTGDQYLKYREQYGLPGRPVDEIIPGSASLYSKQDEQDKYGFIPYLTTDQSVKEFHNTAAPHTLASAFNTFADARKILTNHTYNYDGEVYDGKDFDKKYDSWIKATSSKEIEPFTDDSLRNEFSVPLTMYIKDSVDGKMYYAPNDSGEMKYDERGLPMIDFHTGNPDDNWYFDSEEDFNKSIKYDFINDDHPVRVAWANMDPLTLSDGKQIRADIADKIYRNKDSYADYGFNSIAKKDVQSPLDNGEWLPWITDIALSSAPLFNPYTAWTQAASGAFPNAKGFRAGYSGEDGTYRMLSEKPTESQALTAAAASALLPLTEKLFGSLGKGVVTRMPFMNTLTKKYPDIFEHPLAIAASGTAGEGLEEVPGNLVEESQNTGSFFNNDYFANPYYYQLDENGNVAHDENGNPLLTLSDTGVLAYDSQGHQLRDVNTSFGDRVGNFIDDAPLSMLGGAALGAIPATVQGASARDWSRDRRAERNELGYNLVVPSSVEEYNRMFRSNR